MFRFPLRSVLLITVLPLLAACSDSPFRPFEIFYSITAEQAVIISIYEDEAGERMRTRVYPEDGEIGIGQEPARDELRTLSANESAQIQALFRDVDFAAFDDNDYIPPLDASLWAVNVTGTGEDYVTVLEPSELTEQRNLSELITLGAYLWDLAGLSGAYY